MLIVDGHNLIPKIPGLSLRDIDDEEHLVKLLQDYARVKRKKVVVFFDGAPPGQAGERVYGMLHAHFVSLGRTADDAIRQYLVTLGKGARGATVVTSDRLVQANVRELHAQVLPSEDFARQLTSLPAPRAARPSGKKPASAAGEAAPLAGQDITQWIDLFGLDPTRADDPIELSKKPVKKPRSVHPKASQAQEPKPTPKKKTHPHHGFPRKS